MNRPARARRLPDGFQLQIKQRRRVHKLAQHLLPLQFLVIRQLGAKIVFEVIADLNHLALNFLEVAGFLCLFEQRLNLLMRLHDQTHELLPLIFLEVEKFRGLPIAKPLALQF
jgi:hypothetical protein